MLSEGDKWYQSKPGRGKVGRPWTYPLDETGPALLLKDVQEYLEWCEQNPLWEEKLVAYKGRATTKRVAKMRVATVTGFCLRTGIDPTTWWAWKQEKGKPQARPDLHSVILVAEKSIREQKFAGAAADLLNANIISRDLGLADKTEVTGPGGGPIQQIKSEMTPEEAADLYAQTREAGRTSDQS